MVDENFMDYQIGSHSCAIPDVEPHAGAEMKLSHLKMEILFDLRSRKKPRRQKQEKLCTVFRRRNPVRKLVNVDKGKHQLCLHHFDQSSNTIDTAIICVAVNETLKT